MSSACCQACRSTASGVLGLPNRRMLLDFGALELGDVEGFAGLSDGG